MPLLSWLFDSPVLASSDTNSRLPRILKKEAQVPTVVKAPDAQNLRRVGGEVIRESVDSLNDIPINIHLR
jgi:hypothetical protein